MVSATTVCDNYNNNYKKGQDAPCVTADTTTSINTTTATTYTMTAAGLLHTHKPDHLASHKRGKAVHKNLPAILFDS